MPDFGAWALADITTTGPDPFAPGNAGNASSPGASTITIAPGASPELMSVSDDDGNFSDQDAGQTLSTALSFDGQSFNIGDGIDTDYSYVVRPQGSSDPGDNITVYVLAVGGGIHGVAADSKLEPGVTYDVISIDSGAPTVPFSTLFVCFASGTHILTERGERPVESLRVGTRIVTADRGAQPLRWIGRRRLKFPAGPDPQKPMLLPAGCLGHGLPRRDLILSPQHRVLLAGPEVARQTGHDEVLAIAKALTALPGVRAMNGRREVTYHSLLFDRHEVIRAEGARVESFYPGPYALGILDDEMRAEIRRLFPAVSDDPVAGYGPTARPILGRRDAERLALRLRRSGGATTPMSRGASGRAAGAVRAPADMVCS